MDGPVGSLAAPRPALTAPEQLAVAGAGGAVMVAGLRLATGTIDLGLPCPLRAVTGIPCPLCGMTTSAAALADQRVADAVAANPFFLVLAAAIVVMLGVLLARRRGLVPAARPWGAVAVRRATLVVAALGLLSWAWQLQRFHWF